MTKRELLPDLARLALRLCGLYLAFGHGLGKVVSLFEGSRGLVDAVAGLGFPIPVVFAWAAALAEFVGGLCVAFGFGTRVAAGFAAVTMAVAAFVRHRALSQLLVALGVVEASPETVASWGDPEKAILNLAIFVAILLLGPGRYSLDRVLRKSQ